MRGIRVCLRQSSCSDRSTLWHSGGSTCVVVLLSHCFLKGTFIVVIWKQLIIVFDQEFVITKGGFPSSVQVFDFGLRQRGFRQNHRLRRYFRGNAEWRSWNE